MGKGTTCVQTGEKHAEKSSTPDPVTGQDGGGEWGQAGPGRTLTPPPPAGLTELVSSVARGGSWVAHSIKMLEESRGAEPDPPPRYSLPCPWGWGSLHPRNPGHRGHAAFVE